MNTHTHTKQLQTLTISKYRVSAAQQFSFVKLSYHATDFENISSEAHQTIMSCLENYVVYFNSLIN